MATALLLRTHHPAAPCKPALPPPSRAAVVCRAMAAAAAASASAAEALRSLAPPTRPELLSLDLPRYDPARSRPVDLAVVGGGPAGLAVAQRVAEAGLSVCAIDPSPALVWPNNYGVWVDEFDAMGLSHCLDAVWPSASVFIDDGRVKSLDRPYARVARRKLKSTMMDRCVAHGVRFHQAKVVKVVHNEASSLLICDDGVAVPATVVLDATGFSRCLVQYDKPFNPGYQVAYGILAEVDEHPFDLDKMLFMDWRDSHLPEGSEIKERNRRVPTFLYAMPFSPTRIFLEETSLVARPGLAMDDIQERMAARLRHLGIRVRSVEEDERCVIPMGGPLPVLPQRVVGIGGTTGMVHGGSHAGIVAGSIVRFLDSGNNGIDSIAGDALSAEVWKELWSADRRRQREFFCFGMDILLKLDLDGTRRFFDLEPRYWHDFLSSRLFLPERMLLTLLRH